MFYPRPGKYVEKGLKQKTSLVGQILSRPEHVAAGEEKQVAVRQMETQGPQAEGTLREAELHRNKATTSGHYEADKIT